MWYWGAHGMRHCGRVIIVGGDPEGRAPARVRAGVDARRRAGDRLRRRRPVADDHPPPHPADHHRRRQVSAWRATTPPPPGAAARGRPRRRPGRARGRTGHRARPQRRLPVPRPTVPRGVEVPEEPPTLGADYDTEWARSPVARVARGVIAEGPMRLAVRGLADPEVFGRRPPRRPRRQAARRRPPPPLIFAPNHHSHLDTALMVRAVPYTWRSSSSSPPPPTTSSTSGGRRRSPRCR